MGGAGASPAGGAGAPVDVEEVPSAGSGEGTSPGENPGGMGKGAPPGVIFKRSSKVSQSPNVSRIETMDMAERVTPDPWAPEVNA